MRLDPVLVVLSFFSQIFLISHQLKEVVKCQLSLGGNLLNNSIIESITRLFFFQVGIGDGMPDGLCGEDMEASHATLQSLAESINADLSLLREKQAEASTFTITPLSRS